MILHWVKFVQIERGHRYTQTGEDNKDIAMPHYLTLGHELGHVMYNLKGIKARSSDDNPDFARLGPLDNILWSNPEEHQNITKNENPLRKEHGLPPRFFHRPPRVVLATRMKEDLKERFIRVYQDFPGYKTTNPELLQMDPYEPEFYEQGDKINHPEFYEKVNKRIDDLYRRKRFFMGII